MEKIDLKKKYRDFYQPSTKKVEIVEVPRFQFLMIDGQIEPGKLPGESQNFQEAVQALYSMAYTLKFMSKQRTENPLNFTVMPLEGLWWVEDGIFDIRIADNWCWTLMIMQPEQISSEDFNLCLEQLRRKKGDLPVFNQLRLETFTEGTCVQTMHIGSYADEPATIDRMVQICQGKGYVADGKHHEIYLSDPNRTAPEKMKTVLRQPVRKIQ